jgi:hypothetical protein
MPDDPEEVVDFGPIITVRYDTDEGRVVYDLGDFDPWAAAAILRQVAKEVRRELPAPRDASLTVDEDGD